MHLNWDFSAVQIIWTLTFAGLLVLLVTLMGRERTQRFPWFTTGIVLITIRLLASRLLFGRLAPIPLSETLITLEAVGALVSLVVVVEMARRAFAGARLPLWLVNAAGMVVVAGVVIYLWGPWPAWKTLTADSRLAAWRLAQLVGTKITMLGYLLAIELCIAVLLFGRRFKAGWNTHVQRIVIGLSTVAISQLAIQAIWQIITRTAIVHSRAEYDRAMGLQTKLYNTSSVVYVGVLVWWIVCLWIDEPGMKAAGTSGDGSAGDGVVADGSAEASTIAELGEPSEASAAPESPVQPTKHATEEAASEEPRIETAEAEGTEDRD
jgi:hypothetical protein